ncbi:DUF2461 domain-containing protein [Agrobacterium cavarae]|uniref:DUF2461 domain-containing protein n=1 Tax=Agrobacterium cavarae TaxID=2528239 RepID=UPI0013AF3DE0|nr:DUF2461 domain-containing protein [Agrobacterium cavarae]
MSKGTPSELPGKAAIPVERMCRCSIPSTPLFRTYFPNGLSDGRHASGKTYVKDHDALDFFNLRNFGACRVVSPQMLMSADLLGEAVKSFAAARGLVDYINRATTKLPEFE